MLRLKSRLRLRLSRTVAVAVDAPDGLLEPSHRSDDHLIRNLG